MSLKNVTRVIYARVSSGTAKSRVTSLLVAIEQYQKGEQFCVIHMTHQYNITSVIKFDGFIIQSHEDNSDSTQWNDPDAARSAKRAYVKRGTEKNNKTTTQRYVTASINVGSINYEHAWYIAKMEGIV